ncbi:MAG: AI-2E family transporter, partial [Methanomicrobium sp.]|nr:AI-2E family transporter [Methanomicrobium sp.]
MDFFNKADDNLRYLLTGALILIILVGMNQTAYLINMVVISLILAMIGTPIFYVLKKRGLSDIVSVAIIMVIYAIVVIGFIFLIFESINMLMLNLPRYEELFAYRLHDLIEILKGFGMTADTMNNFTPDWNTLSKITIQVAGGISALVMDGFFIVVITCFLLLEIPALPGRMKKITGGDDKLTGQYQEMCNSMIGWIVAKTKTNIVLGGAFGAMLYALGIDFAIFWGVL